MFPKHPKVSQLCRSLIVRILVPQSARLCIAIIRTDAWLETSVVAQTSIDNGFVVNIDQIQTRQTRVSHESFMCLIIPLASSQGTVTAVAASKKHEASDKDVVSITPAIFQGILNERLEATVDDKAETTKIDLNVKL